MGSGAVHGGGGGGRGGRFVLWYDVDVSRGGGQAGRIDEGAGWAVNNLAARLPAF